MGKKITITIDCDGEGGDVSIPVATPTRDGLMSAADKAKLDSLLPFGKTYFCVSGDALEDSAVPGQVATVDYAGNSYTPAAGDEIVGAWAVLKLYDEPVRRRLRAWLEKSGPTVGSGHSRSS